MRDPYVIITAFLAGETTDEENRELVSWRCKSDENNMLFLQLKELWQISEAKSGNIDHRKQILRSRIENGINLKKQLILQRKLNVYKAYFAAAVIVFFAILAGLYLFYAPQKKGADQDVIFKTPSGQKAEIVLPDGTHIWLNSESVISYSADYNKNKRKVNLVGEAFFDVAADKENLFEVYTENVCVRAYGTSFNVKAYKEDDRSDISLLEGQIDVICNANRSIIADMKPNQRLQIDLNNMKYELIHCNTMVDAIWRYRCLKIERETVPSLVKKMERWYGVDIDWKDSDKNTFLYWMTIKTESLTEMLELINKITPIEYSINGEEVIMRNK
ncbi:MAG: FecR family protein [Bacteroidales bacterium]|jgi:transmembrane sensor|nr:FecR family protein [Bacteroidales bacterium]MDD2264155.1 FecR family protein [Bacteroidales bacterium]MDD2831374.1 FecR family protein [Bacteroidales bacterium]MDD3208368.1 FecR family protein [Bacteroidales bacterium]MDD3696949.1 FecR family protein [Bacteroidales bacterium]